MSPDVIEQPFDSIESTQEYMNILAETILEVTKELHRDHELALQAGLERRTKAIELAMFKLKMLGCYVHKSRRTLNDLRTLRRLILNERLTADQIAAVL
jgi:hypothetical protein